MEFKNIKIAIVHRDGLYRDSLSYRLAQAESIAIVYSSSRLEDLIRTMVDYKPNLLIVEFGQCLAPKPVDASALHAAFCTLKTIVIGVPDREEDILECIEGDGAAGYLLMDASFDDLLTNIRAVMKGEALCSPRIAALAFDRMSKLAHQVDTTRSRNGSPLTRREAEIIRLIDEGLSNKEIATRLNIGVSTVKNHVHNILDKLQLRDRYSVVKHIKEQVISAGRF